jgi:hypothetical protein
MSTDHHDTPTRPFVSEVLPGATRSHLVRVLEGATLWYIQEVHVPGESMQVELSHEQVLAWLQLLPRAWLAEALVARNAVDLLTEELRQAYVCTPGDPLTPPLSAEEDAELARRTGNPVFALEDPQRHATRCRCAQCTEEAVAAEEARETAEEVAQLTGNPFFALDEARYAHLPQAEAQQAGCRCPDCVHGRFVAEEVEQYQRQCAAQYGSTTHEDAMGQERLPPCEER